MTGRSNLPTIPTEALNNNTVLVDWEMPPLVSRLLHQHPPHVLSITSINHSQPTPLIEAQGWVIGTNGEVILTAQASSVVNRWSTPVAYNAQ